MKILFYILIWLLIWLLVGLISCVIGNYIEWKLKGEQKDLTCNKLFEAVLPCMILSPLAVCVAFYIYFDLKLKNKIIIKKDNING